VNSLSTGRAVGIVLAASALVLVPSLFTRDPWNPDEPRATEVAREMVVLGNYLVPHLNGEPYSDKPPLFYWLAAGFWHMGFGLNSGRMVSVLATAGMALVVFALGRRLHSPETGLVAALVTLTLALSLYVCKFGVLDPLLAFFTTASIYCSMRAFEGGVARGRWWLGAYALAALAVLTKGPPGLAVTVLVPLLYGWFRRREVSKGGWWHAAGAVLLLGMVAAWLVPACIAGGPGYTNDILLHQTAKRLVEGAPHYNPIYYYPLRGPAMFSPWVLLFTGALVWSLRWRRGRTAVLAAVWFIGLFVCFSLFAGKRERYLLPAAPAVGLLCARYVVGVLRGEHAPFRWHGVLWKATFVVLALVAANLVVMAAAPELGAAEVVEDAGMRAELAGLATPASRGSAVLAAAVVLAACVSGFRALRGADGERRRFAMALAATFVCSLWFDLVATPMLNRIQSGRELIARAGHVLDEADAVYLYKDDFNGAFNLFTQRTHVPMLHDEDALMRALASDRRVVVVIEEDDLTEMSRPMPWHKIAERLIAHRPACVMANWQP